MVCVPCRGPSANSDDICSDCTLAVSLTRDDAAKELLSEACSKPQRRPPCPVRPKKDEGLVLVVVFGMTVSKVLCRVKPKLERDASSDDAGIDVDVDVPRNAPEERHVLAYAVGNRSAFAAARRRCVSGLLDEASMPVPVPATVPVPQLVATRAF